MIVTNLRLAQIRFDCVGFALDRDFLVVIVKDARKQRKRSREIHAQIQQRVDRPIESIDQRDHRRDGTDGQRSVALRDDQPSAGEIDQQWANLRKRAKNHQKPLTAALLFQRQARNIVVYADEAVVFRLFPCEEFHQHGAGNAQRLRDELIHLVAFILDIGEQLPAGFANLSRRNQRHRNNRDANQRHLPVHRKQRNQRRYHHRNVRNRGGQRAGDDRANPADVAFHAR